MLVWSTFFTALAWAQDNEPIKFSFEGSTEEWRIPDWAFYQGDHVARELRISSEYASDGESSLEVVCEFPGKTWAAALVEREVQLDLSGYNTFSADIYLPKKAPRDLILARLILTVAAYPITIAT